MHVGHPPPSGGALRLRVLTWNLMHGRAVPPAGRDLRCDFEAALLRWTWDVALLQEVPPWWPSLLARRLEADHRLVLTSRNAPLRLRRPIAERWPDLIKSNGGGCNAILVRTLPLAEHRQRRLRWLPERRWLHAVRLGSAGDQEVWIGNLHLTVHDHRAARQEAALAAQTMLRWVGGAAALLGGDFNVRQLALAGFDQAGGHDVDLFFVRSLQAPGAPEVLDRGHLSDHAPLLITVKAR